MGGREGGGTHALVHRGDWPLTLGAPSLCNACLVDSGGHGRCTPVSLAHWHVFDSTHTGPPTHTHRHTRPPTHRPTDPSHTPLTTHRLYQQRIAHVQKLLDKLREGTHPRYQQRKAELEMELEKQKHNAEVRKAFRVITLDHHMAYTTKGAAQDYEFRVGHLKTQMVDKLQRE
jgi:hypothetical protein